MRPLFVIGILILICLINVDFSSSDTKVDVKEFELARKKKGKFPFHALWYGFGAHALAILWWIKVKVIIVAFIIGTAIVWGVRYIWGQKSCPEIVHDAKIIPFDSGIPWHSQDHIDHPPFLHHDHFFDHDPYHAYSSYSPDSHPEIVEDPHSHPHRKQWREKSRQQQGQLIGWLTEDQINELVFMLLGINSKSCRKRFLCEMEFKSLGHPLTKMAFRIVGRTFFKKYVRNPKDELIPKSFQECATVHHECTIIEEDTISSSVGQESLDINDDNIPWDDLDKETSTSSPMDKTQIVGDDNQNENIIIKKILSPKILPRISRNKH